MQGSPQMRALIRAGRELAGHRPLAELFQVIMDLSIEAVEAGRGVLMTLEGDQLMFARDRGEGFKISNTVRDRVLKEKHSLLVSDAQLDQGSARADEHRRAEGPQHDRRAAANQRSRHRPDLYRFAAISARILREDLNLLTVMANVAAIRIEHARLNEIEEAERAMAKDMQQAALIQERLAAAAPSGVAGLDIAGKTVACRTVGGDYYDF